MSAQQCKNMYNDINPRLTMAAHVRDGMLTINNNQLVADFSHVLCQYGTSND